MPKVQVTDKQSFNVPIGDVAEVIYEYGQNLQRWWETCGDSDLQLDYETGDFRLQVVDGTWNFHTGDSQYDTDHRGCWAYATVERGITKKAARALARTMIEECA